MESSRTLLFDLTTAEHVKAYKHAILNATQHLAHNQSCYVCQRPVRVVGELLGA